MNIELVYWRDAHFTKDDFDTEPQDYIMRTVGWVRVSGRFLRIESERQPNGDGARSVTRVPLENVVRREVLKRA